MKNQNKANAGRTQIADISVAGKELSEEHLRIVGGGFSLIGISAYTTYHYSPTCTSYSPGGDCRISRTDSYTTNDYPVIHG